MNRLRDRSGPIEPITRTVPALMNIASHYGGTLATATVVLLLTPLMIHKLGAVGFGLWSLCLSIGEYLNLAGLGTRTAIIKYAAEHQARGDAQKAGEVVQATVLGRAAAGLVAFAASALLSAFLLPHLRIPAESLPTAQRLLLIVGAGAAINLPLGVSGALLEGLHRYDLLNWLRIAHAVVRAGGIAAVLVQGHGLLAVCLVDVAAMVLLNLARFVAAGRIHERLVTAGIPSAGVVRAVYGFSLWCGVRDIAVAVVERANDLMLAVFVSTASIASYNIASRAGAIPVEIVVPLVVIFLPLASEMKALGSVERLRELFLSGSKAALAFALPLGLILAIGARTVVTVWIGEGYDEAIPVLRILAIRSVLVAVSLPSESLLMGTGSIRAMAAVLSGQGLFAVALGLALIGPYGPAGLATASTLSAALFTLAVLTPLACRSAGVTLGAWLREAIRPAVLPGLALGIPALILRPLLDGAPAPVLGAVAALLCGVYVVLMIVTGLTPHEKEQYALRIRMLLSRAPE